MTTEVSGARGKRSDAVCTSEASQSSAAILVEEARAMLSELHATSLGDGKGWDAEARTRMKAFQRAEGLPPTGELDAVSVGRLKMRFQQVSEMRQPDEAGAVVLQSPTQAQHDRALHLVQQAVHCAEKLAHHFAHDAPIRQQYLQEVKAWSADMMAAFDKGQLTEGDVANHASRLRNQSLVEARGQLGPEAQRLASFVKKEGTTLTALTEKYALQQFGKKASELTLTERNQVLVRIAENAGVTKESAKVSSRLAPYASRALTAVAIALAVYQVATAEDPVRETLKQGAGFAGFWAGAKIGGAMGLAACGPGAPACGVVGMLAGGILGALVAESAAEHVYDSLQYVNAPIQG